IDMTINVTRKTDRDLEVDVLALQALSPASALSGDELGSLSVASCGILSVVCCNLASVCGAASLCGANTVCVGLSSL
ncbi:MAG: hypothetical protein ACRDJG_09195, partial [Actinomycetota bacterium]